MKVLLVDNYDSFTYNLVDVLRTLGVDLQVVLNDRIDWAQVDAYGKILISPGPGTPQESGQLMELIRNYHQTKSFLGICLGHQAIGQTFGGQLVNLDKPRHGQAATIDLSTDEPLFTGLPKTIPGGLYHSWSVDWNSLPGEFEVIASSGKRIMGIRHKQHDVVGLQFHPESYATPHGAKIIRNWLGF